LPGQFPEEEEWEAIMRRYVLAAVLVAAAVPAHAVDVPASVAAADLYAAGVREVLADMREDEVRAVIAEWYAELQKGDEGHGFRLFAPSAIVGICACETHPGGTPIKSYVSPLTQELAYLALKFSYEIEKLRIDGNFARADVWERGWFHAAFSNEQTYENAAESTFILERDANGDWKIAAFTSRNSAVKPEHADDPMPDLRGDFYRRFPD
jgi:hypothetical protein